MKNREYSRRAQAKHRERWTPVFRDIIDRFLSRPCTDCGEQFARPAMQADHVFGPRKYKISWFYYGNGTEKMLRDELAKCEVRCANCHCIRHAVEGPNWNGNG